MKLYHLSRNPILDRILLLPRVPINNQTKYGYENNTIKRISFSTSIDGALASIGCNHENIKMYVYSPINIDKTKIIIPTIEQVPDVINTNEVWYTDTVNIKKIAVIYVTNIRNRLPYKNNKVTAYNYFWNWYYLELFD